MKGKECERMKKLLVLLLTAMLLAGCAKPAPEQVATVRETEKITEPVAEKTQPQFAEHTVPWGAQYVRTDHNSEEGTYPQVQVIDSLEQLNAYGMFDRIAEACTGYNEGFFKERFLVLVLLEEPSGSISHEVLEVRQTAEDKTAIFIDRIVPEVGTCDMAQWHIIVEFGRDTTVRSGENVQVYLDERLAWDGQYVEPLKAEAQYKEPPEIELITQSGNTVLKPAGYSWTYRNPDGTCVSVNADQTARPLPKENMEQVVIEQKYAETVYAPVSGSTVYEPTNKLGFLIKLHCSGNPDTVYCSGWDAGGTEEALGRADDIFYAETEGFIYEFSVTWAQEELGYSGTANYYVYIEGEEIL